MSFLNLFGGGDSKSQSTNTTDASQRQVTSSQSGQAVQGTGNIVNDSSLVALGVQNNSTAASIISHINDTFAAELGKIADTVKQTSNDTLNSAIASGNALSSVAATTSAGITAQSQIAGAGSGFWSKLSSTQQNVIAIGAAALGAWYFLKPKSFKL